jgi:hypothetical protein
LPGTDTQDERAPRRPFATGKVSQLTTYLYVTCPVPITRRAHLPTGRVSVESVLRLLLHDLGVTARRDDWGEVLDDAEPRYLTHRRWSGNFPR